MSKEEVTHKLFLNYKICHSDMMTTSESRNSGEEETFYYLLCFLLIKMNRYSMSMRLDALNFL